MLRSLARSAVTGAALTLLAGAASAEVTSRTADGFVLNYSAQMTEGPEEIWTALGLVGHWWSDDHAYYASRNMTMDLRPGGCFCETLPGPGGVKHGEVVIAWPDRMLRLNAPLGPLQATGPAAVLTFEWKTEGDGWALTATYAVNGPDMGAFAAPVDGVLGEQFDNLVVYIRAGSPTEVD